MKDSMEMIKQMLCKELDELAEKGEMSAGDLDAVYKLIVAKEKLLRIEELEDELGYSEDGDWRAEGTYARGSSYTRDGGMRGSYARGNSYARRDSRGRYSRDAESMKEKMMDVLRSGDFTSSQRASIQRIIDEM